MPGPSAKAASEWPRSGRPSMGSWVTYGLGSENQNLPGFVVMLDHTGGPINGAKNWSSGFMPASYQGTMFRSQGEPILNLKPPQEMSDAVQRTLLELQETAAVRTVGRGRSRRWLAPSLAGFATHLLLPGALPV